MTGRQFDKFMSVGVEAGYFKALACDVVSNGRPNYYEVTDGYFMSMRDRRMTMDEDIIFGDPIKLHVLRLRHAECDFRARGFVIESEDGAEWFELADVVWLNVIPQDDDSVYRYHSRQLLKSVKRIPAGKVARSQ